MCGRVTVKTTIAELMEAFPFVSRGEADKLDNRFPRYNGAPGLDYPLIILEPDVRGPIWVTANWGFIPRWAKEPGRRPINARREGIATSGMFRAAYRSRRALMPITSFFEWRATTASGAKQPYAIAMKTLEPFVLAVIWETWRDPVDGSDRRTFAIVTCEANSLMATIHDRMPVVLHERDYGRWLNFPDETDPRDLLVPFPSELMMMWPIGRKVGNPRNDTPDILDPVETTPDDPLQ